MLAALQSNPEYSRHHPSELHSINQGEAKAITPWSNKHSCYERASKQVEIFLYNFIKEMKGSLKQPKTRN